MKDSYEQRIQNQFGAFCVRVLKNEARHIQRDYACLLDQEKPLDELTASELEQTAVWDDYFMDEHVFEVLGLPVVVTGNVLFYPQLGVKLCSMAGGGVQKIYMVFLREPSRQDRSGSDLFHLRDGFEIKMNFDRNVSCFIFVNALMHDDFFD